MASCSIDSNFQSSYKILPDMSNQPSLNEHAMHVYAFLALPQQLACMQLLQFVSVSCKN